MKTPLLAALLALPIGAMASPPPSAPPEVLSAAPKGTTLLFFAISGDQPNADAAAVFETAPDKDGVRWRTLSVFGKKDGELKPDFSSEKLIACSLCSQFHDDPFDTENFKVSAGRVHIEQMDGGEKPSTTILDLARQSDGWHVINATRRTVDVGRYNDRTHKLSIPSSGLAKDMDAQWSVPWFINTLLLNQKTNAFSFSHDNLSNEDMWKSQKEECNPQDCKILVQQGDGCISLARDSKGNSFPGSTKNPKKKGDAISQAMSACASSGGSDCKVVRTDCTKGIL